MQIALVTETYPPEVNGVARTLHRLVRGMIERGHTVQIVRPRQSHDDQPSGEPGLMQLIVPGIALPRYEGLHMGLPAGRRLRRQWRVTRPDVVHIATEGPLGLTALRAARRLNLPVTSTFHTNFHQYGKHYGYGFIARKVLAYLRYVHNRTACTMVPSQDVLDQLADEGFRNLIVLARGVDTRLFDPTHRSASLRQSWGVSGDQLVVAYVGRVAREKNIPLAVRTFEQIRKTRPDAKFVIVGDGPARPKLQREHADYIFAGMRKGDDLAAYYASADVFLFPSMSETFGNVVTEAMASGLAAVAFDYAGPRQVIRSGENGVTVPFEDEAAFIQAAVALGQNPQAIKDMRAAARQTAMGLSWDSIVDVFERALNAAIQGNHGSANEGVAIR